MTAGQWSAIEAFASLWLVGYVLVTAHDFIVLRRRHRQEREALTRRHDAERRAELKYRQLVQAAIAKGEPD